jgi:chromate transporter
MTDSHPSALFLVFLRLGATTFGGPAAHIAVMEDDFVRRRQWLTREAFLELVAVSNLLPGPTSTELALHVGFVRAGLSGLLAAGIGFILPGTLATAAIAAAYVAAGDLPWVEGVLYGVKPMAVAVVAAAGVTLLPAGVNTVAKGLAFVAALMAAASGLHELGVLGVGAAAALLGARWRATATAPVLVPLWGLAAPALAVSAAGPWAIFGTFFKIGSLLFGSGYVLFAFLNAELVDRLQWLTPQALLDAIAVGQVTPGPVFTTATFIGYVIDGPRGAFAATAGVFLPAFVFVAASGPLVRLLRGSGASRALMDGVVAASLALLVMVTVALASSGLVDVWTWGLALAAFTVLIVWRVNPMWCLLAGAAVGLLVALAG